MAGTTNPDKTALTAELASARARLTDAGGSLRTSLDVPARAMENFKRHRPAWVAGAALAGFLLSRLPVRRKTVFVERVTGKTLGGAGKIGLVWTAAKFLFGAATPLFTDIAGKIVGEIAAKFSRPPGAGQPARPEERP